MKLSSKNLFVRWAYIDKVVLKQRPPQYTTVCDLVLRAVVVPPTFVMFLILTSPIFLLFVLADWINDIRERRAALRPKQECGPSVIAQWWRDRKERICTIVEIE